MRFAFHREALAEYAAAAHHYAEIDPLLGSRFMDAIECAIDLAIESPLRWPELGDGIHRCLAHLFPYAILYSIEPGYVLIVAVMHCGREPEYWKDRIV